MKKGSYYLLFEGMDLAGKTTAAKNFVKSTGIEWEIRRNSLTNNNPIHLLADSLRSAKTYDAEVLGNLYIAALMADIQEFKYPTINTIQDSTIILRSIAFHTVRGTPRIREVLFDLLPRHPQFDASFVFTANIDERKRRLTSRLDLAQQDVSEEDLMVLQNPNKFIAMETCMIDIAKRIFHSLVVDTSNLTQDMVIEVIEKELELGKME